MTVHTTHGDPLLTRGIDMGDIRSNMSPTPQPPIARATQELSNNIAELDHALGRLIDSVRPAMGPDQGVPSDCESSPSRGGQSEVAEFIDGETSKIREMIHTINSTITRIEL